ncbi:MAG: hypothetical protein ACI3ZL_03545 [Candidatus Cryptobacteroides sp.]
MLTITATNFGLAPEDIQIKEYHNDKMMVLDGVFTVDTTAEEYSGIRPMKLTVADLPFSKSRIGTALVTVLSDGVKYATITKVQIKDKNTISIGKIIPYKSIGEYTVKLSTILIPEFVTGEVALNQKTAHTPSINKGEASDIEIYTVETSDWMMLVFKASALTFDDESQTVEISVPGLPEEVTCAFPVIYNEGTGVALGSKYYPATLENGTIVISKDGNADEASNAGNKFTRIFIVR